MHALIFTHISELSNYHHFSGWMVPYFNQTSAPGRNGVHKIDAYTYIDFQLLPSYNSHIYYLLRRPATLWSKPKTQYVKVLTSTGSIVDVLQKYIGFSTLPSESFQPSANHLTPKTNGSKLFAPAFCFLRQPPVDKITAWPCVISNQNYNRYKIAIASTTSRRP